MCACPRRRIGVDIDDTLLTFSRSFSAFLSIRGYEVNLEASHTWEMYELLCMSKDEFLYLADQFCLSSLHHNMPPVHGAQEAVHRLARAHDLYAVSARPAQFAGEVTELIHRHFGSRVFKGIDLLGHRHDKGEHCVRNGLVDLIDDGAHNAMHATRVGVRAILYDRPWNITAPLPPSVIRVRGWDEILALYGC